jgi:hypothetical protein
VLITIYQYCGKELAKISIELESDKKIENKINRIFLREVRKAISKAAKIAVPDIKEILRKAVYAQPEYESILQGDLQAELGIVDPHTKFEQIIDKWLDGVKTNVVARISGKTLKGTFTIKLLTNDYSEILPIGAYDSINAAGDVTYIPWLQWLLLDGNVTVANYRFGTQPQKVIDRYSRTKRGLMFIKFASRWTMPAQFAGVEGNNFLTRAVASVEAEIQQLLEKTLNRAFK